MRSTSMPRALKSGAAWLACASEAEIDDFLAGLSDGALMALPWLFEFWALPHQLPPSGDWKTWVILGGRGAGKTRAGAEWLRAQIEGPRPLDPGRASRVALLGETYDQVREVMVFGDSGLMNVTPQDRRPQWEAGRRRLVWPNGATATCFSAQDPEALRGPQFDAAWADELAKWKRADEAWDQLQFALRLGPHPQQVVTTTPRGVPVLRAILANPSSVSTHAPTEANRAHLAASFLAEVTARYGGTRLGRQELQGEILDDIEGALWPGAILDGARRPAPPPSLDRVVVAIDPPVTGHAGSDECGIVVVGLEHGGLDPSQWRAWVLEDASLSAARPLDWAEAALAAAARHGADRLVAEVNQGGDLVGEVIRQLDPLVALKCVRASRGKAARAEPIAALYDQGRVLHLPGLAALEDQMGKMTRQGFQGRGSPDRVDALVWALHELMIAPAPGWRKPQVRSL